MADAESRLARLTRAHAQAVELVRLLEELDAGALETLRLLARQSPQRFQAGLDSVRNLRDALADELRSMSQER